MLRLFGRPSRQLGCRGQNNSATLSVALSFETNSYRCGVGEEGGVWLCGPFCGALWPVPCCWSCILCWITASFCSCSGVSTALILGLPSCRICITFCCFCCMLRELSSRTAPICLFSSSTTAAIFCFWSGVSCSSSSTEADPPWPLVPLWPVLDGPCDAVPF